MDFDASRRKVALGGKSRAQSRQDILATARAKRLQRACELAPGRSAIVLQRVSRGLLARRATAHLLRASLEGTKDPASIERGICLLWRCSACAARVKDSTIVEQGCLVVVQAGGRGDPSVLAPACACGREKGGLRAEDWSRRASRLLPALLHTAGCLPECTAAASLALALCNSRHSWAPCCSDRAQAVCYSLLVGCAEHLFHAIASRIYGPQEVRGPLVSYPLSPCVDGFNALIALSRSLLNVGSDDPLLPFSTAGRARYLLSFVQVSCTRNRGSSRG